MKNQALFSSKDKSKKLKCRLLQFLFGVLRVKDKIVIFRSPGQSPGRVIVLPPASPLAAAAAALAKC